MPRRKEIPHEEADLIAGLEEAACRSIADQMHFLHRYKRAIGAYDKDPSHIGDTIFELTRLGLEVHEAIAETNFRLYEELIDRAARKNDRNKRERPEVTKRFSLKGTRGARFDVAFIVDNPTSRRMSLEIRCEGFHDKRHSHNRKAGDIVPGSVNWCRATPQQMRLEPDESAEVRLFVDSSVIAPGEYEGKIAVTASRAGYGESEILIELYIEEALASGGVREQ